MEKEKSDGEMPMPVRAGRKDLWGPPGPLFPGDLIDLKNVTEKGPNTIKQMCLEIGKEFAMGNISRKDAQEQLKNVVERYVDSIDGAIKKCKE